MTFDLEVFHERAVQTPSHESVAEMRTLLVETLAEEGIDPTVDDAGNVLATRVGNEDGPRLVLNTHIDTVPPHIPYGRDGEVVTGRGSCDAKGPLAALLAAFLAVDPKRGSVTLAITPDEEVHSTGAAALRGRFDADGFIVGEPTGLDVCTAARGRFEGTITITGTSAHAAEPESGDNAIAAAGPILDGVATYDEGCGPGEHEQLGRPSLVPTLIEGGEAPNQIPAVCTVTFDRRSVPPETADGFRSGLSEWLRRRLPEGVDLSVALSDRDTPFLEAFATDPDDPLAETLAAESGGAVRPFGAATEASYFAQEAPTVVFGPGVLADEEGAVAHSDREYVRLPEVHAAAEAVTGTLEAMLR
ncbi:M20 family metallopeptidase [Halapricum desulfuricans]|uniref:Acetylornithine deacetylase/Succinyl-diaminopimelate desuccinylase or related deacylase n=1 Tax=Halapricum desulfuricans TaxID=2841257 RepID=A0A897NFI6_9EURY|nr:M20 family metallopeptidase [Halapricum desulfuricans]QSG10195.1 Acetylornithine deacetylase/Succinyl-diaminopimelate desuccinylase or related deacylase [Halapricum desulfuricans]